MFLSQRHRTLKKIILINIIGIQRAYVAVRKTPGQMIQHGNIYIDSVGFLIPYNKAAVFRREILNYIKRPIRRIDCIFISIGQHKTQPICIGLIQNTLHCRFNCLFAVKGLDVTDNLLYITTTSLRLPPDTGASRRFPVPPGP